MWSHSVPTVLLRNLHTIKLAHLKCACRLSHSVVLDYLQPHGLQPTRLSPWDFTVKNTGLGCHFLFQAIFLIQEWNLCLWHLLRCRWSLYPLSQLGSFKWSVSNVNWASFQHGGSVTRMNFPREEMEWKPCHFHDLPSEVAQRHFCYVTFLKAQPISKERGIR